jgi:glycosyltransferase involved in cell wall biosynthesis
MRILFVAMAKSVHAARWIGQLRQTGWDIHVFDMEESGLSPELRDVTAYTYCRPRPSECNVERLHTVFPFSRGGALARKWAPPVRWIYPSRIESLVDLMPRLQPDIIHSLEMQHESYPLLEVRRRLGGSFPVPWIYSSWGSDIYHFGRDPSHRGRIGEVLRACDYYIADCRRDIKLALEYGFSGEVLGAFPGAGGFDLEHMRSLNSTKEPSKRRVIALKGYGGWCGLALSGLTAVRNCAELLTGYTVEIFSASPEIVTAARRIAKTTGIEIVIRPRMSHDGVIDLMGRARAYIGLSISDGTPNTMLEAMTMGACPIQTDTESTGEWITSGENGFIVPIDDPKAVEAALRQALTDDGLVDRAAALNDAIVSQRIDRSVLEPQVVRAYEKVYAASSTKCHGWSMSPAEILA